MMRILAVVAALVMVLGNETVSAAVTFDWATVGDEGNLADPLYSGTLPGIGSVATIYKIATKEVNLIQYTEFLNAADPNGVNSLELYNPDMGLDEKIAGIGFTSGAAVGSKYAVIGSGLRPVTYVSWNDAARFTNWLQNGQGNGSTEFGVYDMSLETPTRSALATYWIPSENEWYKAAYYDPSVNGPTDNYWLYPTRSDSGLAGNIIGVANSANFHDSSYAKDENGLPTNLTDGGAYGIDSVSYYGTYDQAGNVWEWHDTIEDSLRGVRGGGWGDSEFVLNSSFRFFNSPTGEIDTVGFRVASVPEPTAAMLTIFGAGACMLRRRRKV